MINSCKNSSLRGLLTGLKNLSGKVNQLIVAHIGCEQGFVNCGLWAYESHFMSDFKNCHLNLACNCVIVICEGGKIANQIKE
jgi:hypothetical protein